ncbi:hypothetical protein OF83DRAFT_851190 [Amylostereum chailletii]|nr:hypothetical protein OF83DRAFT_851190 [Amylostereum chailletii]
MPKWQDPAILAADSNALVKFQLVVVGIYIWEFVTTLGYDWSYITGWRSWKWTTWLYEGCRLSVLASLTVIAIGFGSLSGLNCKVLIKFTLMFPYLGELFASSLIAVRAIAIWNRNTYIVVPAVSALLAQLCVLISFVVIINPKVDSPESCTINIADETLPFVIATLVSDIVLFLCMFTGLWRHRESRRFGVFRFLWDQGLVWIAAAVVAEVPPIVFLGLNLNDPFDLMFQQSGLIILSIAATRMYRGLTNFRSGRIEWTFTKDPRYVTRAGTTHALTHRR